MENQGGQSTALRWSKYIFRTVWVALNNLYCIPVHLLIVTLCYPVYLVSPALWYKIEETLFSWILTMVAVWNYTAEYHLAETGDSLDECMKSKMLFMPNHQSTADVPFLMSVFSPRVGYFGRIMWLMDKFFKFTNFGVCSWVHDDFFIQAGKSTRDQSLAELRSHLMRVFSIKGRDCLVLFPEGGFLRKRKAVSQAFAKKRDLPVLEHCTVPRTGALDVIMEVLGPNGTAPMHTHIQKVVDVTIAYPEGKPLDLLTIITGSRPPCTTYIHYRVFDAKELPTDSEELFQWMVKLYEEKDRMLGEYYRTGEFPYRMFDPSASAPMVTSHNPTRYFLLHSFFILCSTAAYLLLSTLYSALSSLTS